MAPQYTRPRDQMARKVVSPIFRDQLSISAWMGFGAILQGLLALTANLFTSRVYMAYLPALAMGAIYILQRIVAVSTYTPGREGEIMSKVTASFDRDPKSDGSVCIFLLTFTCRHPLGFLQKDAGVIAQYALRMSKSLHDRADEFDYLGARSYLGKDFTDRNEICGVYYFRNKAGLLNFARDKLHREGWDWWNKRGDSLRHLGITHEMYEAPAGNWEAIYVNVAPTGLAATKFSVPDNSQEDASIANDNKDAKVANRKRWISPIVDASTGKHRTSAGRLGHGSGEENDEYYGYEYSQYKA